MRSVKEVNAAHGTDCLVGFDAMLRLMAINVMHNYHAVHLQGIAFVHAQNPGRAGHGAVALLRAEAERKQQPAQMQIAAELLLIGHPCLKAAIHKLAAQAVPAILVLAGHQHHVQLAAVRENV